MNLGTRKLRAYNNVVESEVFDNAFTKVNCPAQKRGSSSSKLSSGIRVARSKKVPIPCVGKAIAPPTCRGSPIGEPHGVISLCNHTTTTLYHCSAPHRELKSGSNIIRNSNHIALRRERKLLSCIRRDSDECMIPRKHEFMIRQYLEFVSRYRGMCSCTLSLAKNALASFRCLMDTWGKSVEGDWYYRINHRLLKPKGASACYCRLPHQH